MFVNKTSQTVPHFYLNLMTIVESDPNANYLVSFLTLIYPLYPSICWGAQIAYTPTICL